MTRPIDLDAVTLTVSAHKPDSQFCVMELTAYLANEPWSDHPLCASPIIASFLRSWNDVLDDTTRQRLKPYAARVIGTNTGPAHEETRAWLVTDWLVHVQAPAWLDLANLHDRAQELRGLPALTSAEIAIATQGVIEQARQDAAAAGAAAGAAAVDAAWAAAGDAAVDAAGAAAGDAAGAAAGDAAGAAAGDAAVDAAGAAAWAAAGAAAGAAAREKLRPTVELLQASAFDLLDRLIAVGRA
jgi:hypothetical protein